MGSRGAKSEIEWVKKHEVKIADFRLFIEPVFTGKIVDVMTIYEVTNTIPHPIFKISK